MDELNGRSYDGRDLRIRMDEGRPRRDDGGRRNKFCFVFLISICQVAAAMVVEGAEIVAGAMRGGTVTMTGTEEEGAGGGAGPGVPAGRGPGAGETGRVVRSTLCKF